MPCSDGGWTRSVDDSAIRDLEKRNDKLARIACAAMTALEENGIEDFVLLQNEEVREWWTEHKEFDRQRRAKQAERERIAQVKKDALAKLSAEERKILGIKTSKSSG